MSSKEGFSKAMAVYGLVLSTLAVPMYNPDGIQTNSNTPNITTEKTKRIQLENVGLKPEEAKTHELKRIVIKKT